MAYKVFVDGGAGTTGLKIHQRLADRGDIEILHIEEAKRKDLQARLAMIEEADITFLCLPDQAAKEIAAAAPKEAKILDTSTAHRINPEWTYGMPELNKTQRESIKNATRVAVPGCHASGFIFAVKPLVEAGVLPSDYPIAATSVTGYSGGGKKMIARHEESIRPDFLFGAGQYGLTQQHKHLPEMAAYAGLTRAPGFLPIVIDHFSGMVTTIPLQADLLNKKLPLMGILDIYKQYYRGEEMIHVMDQVPEDNFIHSNVLSGRDDMQIFVYGNEDRPVISARFDNLGKGASGAAVQNMNIMLGIDEKTSLQGDF